MKASLELDGISYPSRMLFIPNARRLKSTYPARSPEGLEKPDPVSPPAITLGVVERRRRGAKRRTLLVMFVLSIVRVIVVERERVGCGAICVVEKVGSGDELMI